MEMLQKLGFFHFEQMALLESRFYGEEHITPPEQAFAWYERFPYTTVAAANQGQVVGFVNLFPVCGEIFQKLVAGELNDRELTVDGIIDIHAPCQELNMFLSCIVVEPGFRRLGLARQLLRSAAGQYTAIEGRCRLIVTDNVTPEGERFSVRYGFLPAGKTRHGTALYLQPYSNFCSRLL